MEYLGKWKVHSVLMYDDNGNEAYASPEKYIETTPSYVNANDAEEVAHEKSEREMAMAAIASVEEDGKIKLLMPISPEYSEEDIKAAVDAGEIELVDGLMLIETVEWKLKGEELYINTGIEGTIDGEAIDTSEKGIDDEGFLVISGTRYVRV